VKISKSYSPTSVTHYVPQNYKLKIIPSLFEPEVFFSKFILVVEGAGDATIFFVLSERLDNTLEKNDITVIGPDGSGNVNNYHLLFAEYGINHLVMVDSPYKGQLGNNVIVLKGKLENELQKLGWEGAVESSIKPNDAYKFITNLVKTDVGLAKIGDSILGQIFIRAVKEAGGKDPFMRSK